MLKRRKVFAVVAVGPGTGELAKPQVRASCGSEEEALAAKLADEERFAHSLAYFTYSIAEAEELSVDAYPKFVVVVLRRMGDSDRTELHATVLHEGVGMAWAHSNSVHALMVELTFSSMGSSKILRTNNDRSPDVARIVPFLLGLQREMGLGISVEASEKAMEWARVGDELHALWRSLSSWWWQWCQSPQLVPMGEPLLQLQVSDGFVVTYSEEGYAKSVWFDEAPALADAEGPDRYGHEFVVRPVKVLRSDLFAQTAAAAHQDHSGVFHATVFRLPLPDMGVDPEDEWLWPFQMCMWGKGQALEQAWLRVLHHVFQETLVHFPEFTPRMFDLPLAALAREGYRVPDKVRQRLEEWATRVEEAQTTYLAAITAAREEMPR